jgi:hypothetical protein
MLRTFAGKCTVVCADLAAGPTRLLIWLLNDEPRPFPELLLVGSGFQVMRKAATIASAAGCIRKFGAMTADNASLRSHALHVNPVALPIRLTTPVAPTSQVVVPVGRPMPRIIPWQLVCAPLHAVSIASSLAKPRLAPSDLTASLTASPGDSLRLRETRLDDCVIF